jgi:hypothetical protein
MTRPTRTLLIKGPFTDFELARFIRLAQQIETGHPDDNYEVVIDGLDTEAQMEQIYAKAPPTPGYQRITVFTPLHDE